MVNIPDRLHNVAGTGVAGANEIIDDNKQKPQSEINEAVSQEISDIKDGTSDVSLKTLKEGLDDTYRKSETYNKTELNNMITTPSVAYVDVTATDQTTAATDVLPATGEANTIYRIGNWDGTQYNDSVFSEYAWNGSAYIKLSTKSQIGEVYDISVNHADTKYADLAAALGTNGANIPQSLRKGGMSVKFVQSSDNKYVQYRLMLSEFTADTENWAIAEEGVYIENFEFIYVKTDKDDKILWGIKTNGSIYYGAGVPHQVIDYIEEKIEELNLNDVNDIVAFLDGLEDGDKTLLDLLNEKVDKEEGKSLINAEFAASQSVVDSPEYMQVDTDSDNRILSGRRADGTKFENLPFDIQGIKIEVINNPEYIQLYVDSDNKILSGIKKDGTQFNPLEESDGDYDKAIAMVERAAANIGTTPTVLNVLNNLPKGAYNKQGVKYNITGFMSFHDDDTYDPQIPISCIYDATPETRVPTQNTYKGGFASFLFPFLKSITERHILGKKLVINQTTHGYSLVDNANNIPINGNLVYGLAAEGQRTGLTGKLYSDVDGFDGTLNLCGKIASKLHYKYGWDIMCHSMTARYIPNSYWVKNLNDPLIPQIEANATHGSPNTSSNSYVHCTDNNCDYEYRFENNVGAWHLVSRQYIRPYLAKTLESNAPLYFNPRYSEAFQVGEWVKRAKIAGLPYTDCGVTWGSSGSKKVFLERFEFIHNWISSGVTINDVPLGKSTFNRMTMYIDGTNAWTESKYTQLKDAVDSAISTGAWLITNGHVYMDYEANRYLDGIDYGSRRYNDYNQEWIVPLNQEELETIDENNYWEIPPSRLGINSWAEWYPCPGTVYDMFMNVIEYAISKGMEFGSTEEGLRRYANIFNIGFLDTTNHVADQRLDNSEKDPTWNNYIIKGADGSTKYNVI